MTKDDVTKRLIELGFTQDGNDFSKDILVFRHNDAENRFEVFYKASANCPETPPAYLYEELYRDMKQNAFEYYVNNLYEAIKEF
jgi:hypothetical protein